MPPIDIAKRASIGLCLCLGLSGSLPARKSDLAALNQQLSNEIVRANLRSIVVVDFVSEQGEPSTLGWYLADELSENCLVKKPKFRVLDRSEVRLSTARCLVSVRRVTDNTLAATESVSIPHSRILDVLKPPPELNGGMPRLSHSGLDGIGVPRCIWCPIPGYTDRARDAKAQGTIVLSVVVTEDGHAGAIAVVKGLGFGLTQKAIEAASGWRFKPATSAGGEPVAVVVPVEVTMRLY